MKIKDLIENGYGDISSDSGVYIVKVPKNLIVTFNDNKVNSTCNPYEVSDLQKKYNNVKDKSIVYIGKAKNLRRRIRQYVNFGLNKGKIHKGGRAIFQIDNYAELEIEIIQTSDYATLEKQLQRKYKESNGNNLPLANKRIG